MDVHSTSSAIRPALFDIRAFSTSIDRVEDTRGSSVGLSRSRMSVVSYTTCTYIK